MSDEKELEKVIRGMARAYVFRVQGVGLCITCTNKICGVIGAKSLGSAGERISEIIRNIECDKCAGTWHRKISISIEVGSEE